MDSNRTVTQPADPAQRSSQACERCRVKRARCSGDRPCQRCQQNGEECTYGYPRGGRRRSILNAIDEHTNRSAPRPKINTHDASTAPESSGPRIKSPDSARPDAASESDANAMEDADGETDLDDATNVSSTASPIDRPLGKRNATRAKSRKTRISSACLECKKRRRKCTGERPCQTCLDFQTECIYDPTQDRRSKAYFQKRLADGIADAGQFPQNDELMTMLRSNSDLSTEVVHGMQRSLRIAENSSSSTEPSTRPSMTPSTPSGQRIRMVCEASCELHDPGSPRQPWCVAEFHDRQIALLQGPDHLILPHIIEDESPLSMMYMEFRTGVNRMLAQGMALDAILGPIDPIVDLLFRPRRTNDRFTSCSWACELARIHVNIDLFTQLANAFLLARYMRWVLSPSLENYLLLPEIMRPTRAQRTIPHYPSADLFSIPAVREGLVRGQLSLAEPIGTTGTHGIKFHWPFNIEKAVDIDPETGTTTVSRLLGTCAADPKNWSCSKDFLVNTPMGGGILNVINHQHGWE